MIRPTNNIKRLWRSYTLVMKYVSSFALADKIARNKIKKIIVHQIESTPVAPQTNLTGLKKNRRRNLYGYL